MNTAIAWSRPRSGILTIVSMIWLFRADRRKWLRWLGVDRAGRRDRAGRARRTDRSVPAALVDFDRARLSGAAVLLDHRRHGAVHVRLVAARAADPVDEDPQLSDSRACRWPRPSACSAQLALGAAARHKAIGSSTTSRAAPVVTGVILWVSLRILLHYVGKPRIAARRRSRCWASLSARFFSESRLL